MNMSFCEKNFKRSSELLLKHSSCDSFTVVNIRIRIDLYLILCNGVIYGFMFCHKMFHLLRHLQSNIGQ
jgi:hypothetical protein